MRIRHNDSLQTFLLTVQLPDFNRCAQLGICGIQPGEGYDLAQNRRFHGRGYFTHLGLTQTDTVTCRGNDAAFDIKTDEVSLWVLFALFNDRTANEVIFLSLLRNGKTDTGLERVRLIGEFIAGKNKAGLDPQHI